MIDYVQFNTEIMKEKIIIKDYQNLEKRPISESFSESIPPEEMINLFKEYLPIHIGVGTVWDPNKTQKFEETKRLASACHDFRKKILEFGFFGSIIFIMNGSPIVVRIYFDEESDKKEIEVTYSIIIEYKYEFQL